MKRSTCLLLTLGLLVAISLTQIGCSGYSGVAVAGPAYGGVAYDAVLRNLRSSFRSVVTVPLDALARGTHRRSDKFQRYLDPRGLPKKPLRGDLPFVRAIPVHAAVLSRVATRCKGKLVFYQEKRIILFLDAGVLRDLSSFHQGQIRAARLFFVRALLHKSAVN